MRTWSAPFWVAVGFSVAISGQPTVTMTNAATSTGPRAIYETVTPVRILDTRAAGQGPALAAGTPRTVQITGVGGVPADATAVVLSATIRKPTLTGFLTVYPAGSVRPDVSNVNFLANATITNLTNATLGDGGAIVLYSNVGPVDVLLDVVGYYRGHDHDDRYLTKAQAQGRSAADAFTCAAPAFIRSVAADGTPTCAAPVTPASPFLGLPTSSSISLSANSTSSLTRDVYFDTMTLGDNAILRTNGWRLFVRGTLTMGNGAHIERDGGNGNTTSSGAGTSGGTLGMSGVGGCGVAADIANSLGGNGGGAAGGNVTRPLDTIGGGVIAQWTPAALTGRLLDGTKFNGGAGGEGVNCPGTPGAGGGGGGVLVMGAGTIVVPNGTASITANGGSSVGQGGGGGGVVILASQNPQPAGLVVTANGGVGASGNGTAGTVRWLLL